MVKVEFSSGICGFHSSMIMKKDGNETVDVEISTNCPNIKKMISNKNLNFDPMAEVFGYGEAKLQDYAKELPHKTCPFYISTLKGIEAEAGLALPKDVHIKIVKE